MREASCVDAPRYRRICSDLRRIAAWDKKGEEERDRSSGRLFQGVKGPAETTRLSPLAADRSSENKKGRGAGKKTERR